MRMCITVRLTRWQAAFIAMAAPLHRSLDRPGDDPTENVCRHPRHPVRAFAAFADNARELQRWHDNGKAGARPPGRLRTYPGLRQSLITRLWATPLYRTVYDPDARPERYVEPTDSDCGNPQASTIPTYLPNARASGRVGWVPGIGVQNVDQGTGRVAKPIVFQ